MHETENSIPIIAFGQAKPLLILRFQVLLCFQFYLAKRVTIDPILAKYSWQIEHFKYQTISTIKKGPYPCIDSAAQLTALRLNLFCFIICFYFVWPNFSNLLELTCFWAPNKNYATIFIFYLHSHFSFVEYKAIEFFQTLGMLNHGLFFTFCCYFVNKEQLNYPCM